MGPILPEVFAFVDEIPRLAAFLAICPKVGAPQQKWHLPSLVIQRRISPDLVLDQLANGKGTLVGEWLRVQIRAGVSGVAAAGKVGDLQVRKTLLEQVEDFSGVIPQLRGMLWVF